MAFSRHSFQVPLEIEDDFCTALAERGSLGCEVGPLGDGDARVVAYFPDLPPAGSAAGRSGEELAAPWWEHGVRWLEDEIVADRDWLAEHRAAARPIEVGRRFVVDPRDIEDRGSNRRRGANQGRGENGAAEAGRELLRIPARAAFGTGSHESTRLAVEWLEELATRGALGGSTVLDVGTGSGILAFVALRLGARRVVAFDVDPAAPLIARSNAALNHTYPLLFAGRSSALGSGPAFDLALVNVLPERILHELPRLVSLLRPQARLLSSGNLLKKRDALARRFAASGLVIEGETTAGEWAAYLLARAGDRDESPGRKWITDGR